MGHQRTRDGKNSVVIKHFIKRTSLKTKNSHTKKVLLIFLLATLVNLSLSCGDKIEGFEGFLKPEIIHLLSRDSSKNWIRIEYSANGEIITGNCSDSLTYKFMAIGNKEDTSGYLFVRPKLQNCGLSNFCDNNPLLCEYNMEFCEKDTVICPELEEDFLFAGAWYVPNPLRENDKIDVMLLTNYNGLSRYQINYITSINLELIHEEGETGFFEKFKAE